MNTANPTRFWLHLALSLAVLLTAFAPANARTMQASEVLQASEVSTAAVLEPDLARALAQAGPDDTLRVIVVLREQADPDQVVRAAASRQEARVQLVAALQALAERSQAPLRDLLTRAQVAGDVESFTPFWIFNGLAVRAHPVVIRALAAHPAVAVIYLDHQRQWLSGDSRFEIANSRFEIANSNPQSAISNLQSATSNPEPPQWNIARLRAPQVWASLHISGTGAVVASMDTGVDWLHPALQANYRGYNPHGSHVHVGNWFDAVNGALYPLDDHGHGTHTIGTAVGQGGIGVAPGAQWIAVKVLNSGGIGYDSWIHAGFQWLLAPGGDPARAPDVVNCSWGNSNGQLTTFQPDLQALRAAGILPVFANGNNGPEGGTVSSPASLPEAVAVGASDAYDEVTVFSGRGPSPWGQIRPHVVAPGTNVRSSLPGGRYGEGLGTSMAAPHVAGIAALLRAVSPTLGLAPMTAIITATAVPLGDPVPNNDAGWGRVDAFAAVAALTHPGLIAGTVRRADDAAPVAAATVAASEHGGGGGGTTTTDAGGAYLLALAPSTYDLHVTAFGYQPVTVWGVEAVTGTTTVVDVALALLPGGVLRGRVTDASTGAPVTATVAVSGTPLAATGAAYTFTLPAGAYTVQARQLGYRVVTATAVVTAGQVTTADLALPPAPAILLVDSGGWNYTSQIGYYRQALDDLAYAYDEWAIRRLPADLPAPADVAPYDVVVWSAPWDGPGYIGAQGTITSYLSSGGRLFLSGQDVGYLDSGPLGYSPYYRDYLKVRLAADDAGAWTLTGLPGDLFDGLTLTIAGPGGADNQRSPDALAVDDPDAAAALLVYEPVGATTLRLRSGQTPGRPYAPRSVGAGLRARPATTEGATTNGATTEGATTLRLRSGQTPGRPYEGGVRVGTCLDYRVVYLSFGFEAINDRADRRAVLGRSLDWLTAPLPTVGLELSPAAQTRVGAPGTVVTHTLRLRHTGQGGSADTVSLSIDGASWPTHLSAPSLTLSPCATATVVVSVTVPLTASWDAREAVTLTARSALSPTLVLTAALTTKAPAPVLLVDDDRWFEQLDRYEAALTAAGLAYDVWQTCPALGSCREQSPPLAVLQWYPQVVWWTGYDWYAPVTAREEATLAAYLASGGRLFLSSQDFLYYHGHTPFSRDFLGVLAYTEAVTPTLAQPTPGNPLDLAPTPSALLYPYDNWSDGVQPTPGTAVVWRDQNRLGSGLARRAGGHAALFLAFPFEALPEATRPAVIGQAVGWLSWLGGSTFAADRGAVNPGDTLTYTLRVQNDGPLPVPASLSNTLPLIVTMVPGSLSGPADYVTATRRVEWSGTLPAGAALTVTYRVTVTAGLPAAPIANVARLRLDDQGIGFDRVAWVRLSAPDLSPSALWAVPDPARPGATVTHTLALVNAGPADALAATAAISLPLDAALVPGSLAWEGGGAAEELPGGVRWSGPLAAHARVTITVQSVLTPTPTHPPFYSVAFLADGAGGDWERAAWVAVQPLRLYLPLVLRGQG